jgi:hypothetical protein
MQDIELCHRVLVIDHGKIFSTARWQVVVVFQAMNSESY